MLLLLLLLLKCAPETDHFFVAVALVLSLCCCCCSGCFFFHPFSIPTSIYSHFGWMPVRFDLCLRSVRIYRMLDPFYWLGNKHFRNFSVSFWNSKHFTDKNFVKFISCQYHDADKPLNLEKLEKVLRECVTKSFWSSNANKSCISVGHSAQFQISFAPWKIIIKSSSPYFDFFFCWPR